MVERWPEKYALAKIREACRDGLLHPFRVGTVNRFTLEEVVRFVCERFSPGEMINTALVSGFELVLVPTALILKALLAAADGRWKPDPKLYWPDGVSSDEPVTGTRLNRDFPAPTRDSHIARVDRDAPDDSVPHIRTRIRAASEPKSRRLEKRQAEADARAARRVKKPAEDISDDELKMLFTMPHVDDDPVDDISPEELALALEPHEPPARARKRTR
ncbi:MAG TPA: hypothetical protein VIF83_06130 [Gemmatimonadaceae bacterium]